MTMSTKKTIWTVAAGTTAAVLMPGVAYAMAAGGTEKDAEEPVQEQVAVQIAEKPAEEPVTLSASSPAEVVAESSGPASEIPPVEQMMTANSPVSAQSAMSAQSAPSAVSAQSALGSEPRLCGFPSVPGLGPAGPLPHGPADQLRPDPFGRFRVEMARLIIWVASVPAE